MFLVCYVSAFSQGFKVRHAVINSSNNSTRAIYEVGNGSYIGTGYAIDTITGQSVGTLVLSKLDNQGQIVWQKKHKGGNVNYLNNIFVQHGYFQKDTNIYYTACAVDSIGAQIGVLMKFSSNGDVVWRKLFRDSASIDLIPQCIAIGCDGGILITGNYQNWNNSIQQGLLIKTDANGNELWRKKLNKSLPNVQDGKGIVQDSATKKIAIVGFQYFNSIDVHDNILVLDSLGNILYQGTHCISGIGGSGWSLIQTKDKKIVMSGVQYYSENLGTYNCGRSFAVKFDINSPNIPIWKIDGMDKLAIYNGFTSTTELPNGDILFGGFIDTTQGLWNGPNDQPALVLARFTLVDQTGNIKWNRYYSYKNNLTPEDYWQTLHCVNYCPKTGGWVAAIEEYNYGVANKLFYVKYDSTGCDTSSAYCQFISTLSVAKSSKVVSAIAVFPNPCHGEFKILNRENVFDEIWVFNSTGRIVTSEQCAYKTEIEVKGLEPGLYIISAKSNRKSIIYYTKVIVSN